MASTIRNNSNINNNNNNKDEDTKSYLLNWEVPLRQFQVDSRLFKPLPTLISPPMMTPLNHVTLEWTLSLSQTKTDARVTLNHQTKGIPNLGVQYIVMAYRRDQTTSKLTAHLREALAKTVGCQKPLAHSVTDVLLQTKAYIFNGNESGGLTGKETVKLCVCVYISESRFHPKNVMANIISQYEHDESELGRDVSGVVGMQLWAQAESGGELCDIEIECCGEPVYAHSPVLFAFSPPFAEMLQKNGYKKNGWHLVSNGVRATAVREVLYYVYNRKVSPKLSKAPLNEVLEASRLFGVPMGLKLHVEEFMVQIMDRRNLAKMWRMAQTFDLKVIRNMVKTRCENKPDVLSKLEEGSGVRPPQCQPAPVLYSSAVFNNNDSPQQSNTAEEQKQQPKEVTPCPTAAEAVVVVEQ